MPLMNGHTQPHQTMAQAMTSTQPHQGSSGISASGGGVVAASRLIIMNPGYFRHPYSVKAWVKGSC